MARIVVHEDALDEVDPEPLMRRLAEDVAQDMRNGAPTDDFQLRDSIRVVEVTGRRAVIVAEPRNPKSSTQHKPYAYWVVKGTSDTRANPFMQRATYRYRSP